MVYGAFIWWRFWKITPLLNRNNVIALGQPKGISGATDRRAFRWFMSGESSREQLFCSRLGSFGAVSLI
jgi:hypothetical protein